MNFQVLHRLGLLLPLSHKNTSNQSNVEYWLSFIPDTNDSRLLFRRNHHELNRALYSGFNEIPPQAEYFHVPRFLQAVLTLIICTIIMSTTLCLIIRVKYWCRKKFPRHKRENSLGIGLDSIRVNRRSEQNGGTSIRNSNSQFEENLSNDEVSKNDSSAPSPGISSQPSPSSFLEAPPRLVRRISGPFGDDALEFAHQSYKKKKSIKSSLQNGHPISKLISSKSQQQQQKQQPNEQEPEESYKTKL